MTVSKAVNAYSFAKYIASQLSYLPTASGTKTNLSETDKNKVIGFLLGNIKNTKIILNIRSANNMINKLRQMLALGNRSVNSSIARKPLSYETAKQLLNKQFPSEYRCYFTNFRTLASNTNLYGNLRWARIDSPSADAKTLLGTLIGGGGGGSGAITGDGDKNASYTVISGAGADGGTTHLYINGEAMLNAIGGTGGKAKSEKAYSNPAMNQNGADGNVGVSEQVNVSIKPNDVIYVISGQGGGGGGGCCATAGGSTGGVTYTASSGNGSKGGDYRLGANEWSGEDSLFAGGGGGGGASYSSNVSDVIINSSTYKSSDLLVGYLPGNGGASNSSGPVNQVGTKYNGSVGSSLSLGAGGAGGYATNGNSQSHTSQELGSGGSGGKSKNTADVVNWANGGSGGTRGGFKVNSSCTALDCLMAVQCGTYTEEYQTYKEDSTIIFTSSGYGGYSLTIYDNSNNRYINSGDIVPIGTQLSLRFTLKDYRDAIKEVTINGNKIASNLTDFYDHYIETVAQGKEMNIKVKYGTFNSVKSYSITATSTAKAYNPNNYLLTNQGLSYNDQYDGFGIRYYTTGGTFLNAHTVDYFGNISDLNGTFYLDDPNTGNTYAEVKYEDKTVKSTRNNVVIEFTYCSFNDYEV